MSNRLTESLLKHMNIKSVYYYNSNHADLKGRVDDKFIPEWSKFVAGKNDKPLVANNKLLGDAQPSIVKQLFIIFTSWK